MSSRKNLKTYITERYGSVSYELISKLSKLRVKKARYQNHIVFLKKCRDSNIIPKGLKIRSAARSEKAKKIDRDAGMARVRERLDSHKQTVAHLIQEANSLEEKLKGTLNTEDYQKVIEIIRKGEDKEYAQVAQTQKNKFNALTKAKEKSEQENKKKQVVNKSTKILSEAQMSVLSKGLKFAVTPTTIPKKEMIVAIESSLVNVDRTTADTVRVLAANMIQKSKPPKPNVPKEERKAIRELEQMEDIVVLPADKGNVTVVMDKQEYQEKVDQLLQDQDTYKHITRDPSNKAEKEVRQNIKSQDVKININLSNTRLARFIGYPKIHKDGMPLRPVIDSRESATYDLAKRMTRTIQPIIGQTERASCEKFQSSSEHAERYTGRDERLTSEF